MSQPLPAPESRFAPPRTFEHTAPPLVPPKSHRSTSHSQQHPLNPADQHPIPIDPTHPSFLSSPAPTPYYPPTATLSLPEPMSHPLPSPIQSARPEASATGNGTGTMSRLKRSLLAKHRQPLSKTWEKQSFVDECQSAPASDGGSRPGVDRGGQTNGQGRGDIALEERSIGGQVYEDLPSAMLSPSGRPTSLYASPAALRAFKPLPAYAKAGEGLHTGGGHGVRA